MEREYHIELFKLFKCRYIVCLIHNGVVVAFPVEYKVHKASAETVDESDETVLGEDCLVVTDG